MNVSFATAAKSSDAVNEDYVLAGPDAVVLLDGSGVPPGTETGCRHGLPWFVRNLASSLMENARDFDAPLKESLKQAIESTARAHADTCDPLHPVSPSATVVAVRFGCDTLDWLVLGDSFLTLRSPEDVQVVTDQRLKQSAKQQRAALRRSVENSHHLWTDLITEERRLRNHPDGYWIAAGDAVAAEHAFTGSLPRAEVREAVLLSDGAARPVDPFQAMKWMQCLDWIANHGPMSWLEKVRELEDSDPDRIEWPRSKKHDDATVAIVTHNHRGVHA